MVMPTFLMPWLPSLVRRRIAILQKSCLRKESWVQIPLTAYIYQRNFYVTQIISYIDMEYGIITSILIVIGYGLLGGIVAGYTFKRIAKLLVILIALILVAVNYFGYTELLGINYKFLTNFVIEQTELLGSSLLTAALVNIPFAIGFLLGFIIGIRKF